MMKTRLTHSSPLLMALLLAVLLLVGCRQQRAQSAPLPTLFPSPTAPIDMQSAYRTAMLFFDAWQRFDYATMHALTTFAAQDATPFEQFKELYEDVHNLMALEGLTITERALLRQGDRFVVMTYDVDFDLAVMNDFSEVGRNLNLVIDPQANDWRVAWSASDIFPEFGEGATLNFIANAPSRANIYDRDGDVLADQNGIMVVTNVIPAEIPDTATCLPLLAEAVQRPLEDIQRLMDRSGSNWVVEVGTMQPPEYQTYVERLEQSCAATFGRRAVRRYPRGSLMPHVVGYVGYPDEEEVTELIRQGFDAETLIGKSGIERSWDEVLRGTPGGQLVMIAPNGARQRVLSEVQTVIPESIWLTIDDDLQEYVAQVIGTAYAENSGGWATTSRGAAALVMDVNTGEILAMVSYPSYDANALTPFPQISRAAAEIEQERITDDPARPILNRVTQGAYPSGSSMKVADVLAAVDSGIFPIDFTYFSTGRWQQGNDVRFDWFGPGHGRVDFAGALRVSCNSCFYEVGYQMDGVDPFILPTYMRQFGLGLPTGLTDLTEEDGLIPDPDWIAQYRQVPWTFSHSVSMAIGQGEVQVTPLQMTRMYGAIANGGTLYQPQLVRERGILDQRTRVAAPRPNGALDVRQDVIELVQRGLCEVTTVRGSGTAAHIFNSSYGPSPLMNIGVCGKTGTAESGSGPPHSWFIGYAPAERPEIVVTVLVENAGDGSAIATPLTKFIMEYYFFLRESS